MKKIMYLVLFGIILISLVGCKCNKESVSAFGVWWWDDTLNDSYLRFASDNGINEIYYCSDDFDDGTNEFIGEANALGIKVYWLSGEYNWLKDSRNLHSKINKYLEYQNNYKYKFDGIHLDIEPHQDPEFSDNRKELITSLINLASELKEEYSNVEFDYDLPFWLDDIVSFGGEEKEAYKYMIDIADRVFLMSYRDSAEQIYSVSEEEIKYAMSVNKVLVLGVETKSNESDNVSFMDEGKEYMLEELNKLKKLLPESFGVTIHHIKSFYELKG